jgi:cytochrome c oxidase subunit IV
MRFVSAEENLVLTSLSGAFVSARERLALMYAILVPPVLVFVGIMVFESNYTLFTRIVFFGAGT